MALSKIFKISIYHTCVCIKIVEDVKKEAVNIFKRNKSEFSSDSEYRGLVFNFDLDKFYLLLDKNCITYGLIAHEIAHICYDICKINGVDDTEANAFLTELITTETYKFLDKKNIQVGR